MALGTGPEPGPSRSEVCEALGLTPSEWTWAIRAAKKQGKVVQTGERRGARYRVA